MVGGEGAHHLAVSGEEQPSLTLVRGIDQPALIKSEAIVKTIKDALTSDGIAFSERLAHMLSDPIAVEEISVVRVVTERTPVPPRLLLLEEERRAGQTHRNTRRPAHREDASRRLYRRKNGAFKVGDITEGEDRSHSIAFLKGILREGHIREIQVEEIRIVLEWTMSDALVGEDLHIRLDQSIPRIQFYREMAVGDNGSIFAESLSDITSGETLDENVIGTMLFILGAYTVNR